MADDRRLADVIRDCDGAAIAVSGGVDSMTLASFAGRVLGVGQICMVHALSPAVPAGATERVRAQALAEGWRLRVVDAGEFADERYRANPVNRCYFCKSNLYATLGTLSDGVVLSGTNTDDLSDYRPGLEAARENGVRHPYVEAGFAKTDVRALARRLGLPELAELPASPCLSSRVETGIRIEPEMLRLVDEVETWLRAVTPGTVRCRVRREGVVIELDASALEGLSARERGAMISEIRRRFGGLRGLAVQLAAYERGSAFVGAAAGARVA
jgi:uncharacterized protein